MKKWTLLYDDHCPLCVCYTRAFVRTGFLAPEERSPFSQTPEELLSAIDPVKGSNEIPLIDRHSGKVFYGIDALLEILDRKVPLIKKIGNFSPLKWFLVHLYKMISYNRKLIVAKRCGTGDYDCSPVFNLPYRLLFLFTFLLFNTLMLFPLQEVLHTLPYYHRSLTELQGAHFALVICNCAAAFTIRGTTKWEYLGQVNMLATITILLLLPLLLLAAWWGAGVTALYLVLLMILVFREYLRRMEYAGLFQTKRWIAALNLSAISLYMLYLFKFSV